MKTIKYFDCQKVAREMQIPTSMLRKIEKEIKAEFPKDKMMYELHVLRAIKFKILVELIWRKDTELVE